MLKIEVNDNYNIGQLVYSKENHEFQSFPEINSDIVLLLGYVNLGFNAKTGMATQIWGFHHDFNWQEKKLECPQFSKGILRFNTDLNAGDTKRIIQANQWETSYDSNTGWICFGNIESINSHKSVEFFTNTVATLDDGEITSLWLKPEFL